MHIGICKGCGDVPQQKVVDHEGTIWCIDCANVHSVENTLPYECYECGAKTPHVVWKYVVRKMRPHCEECANDDYDSDDDEFIFNRLFS